MAIKKQKASKSRRDVLERAKKDYQELWKEIDPFIKKKDMSIQPTTKGWESTDNDSCVVINC